MYSDCIPDNYDLWKSRDREQEEWLQHRPKCICCGEHIQDDSAVQLKGDYYCDRCLDDVEVKVELEFEHKITTDTEAEDQSEELDENNYIDGYSLDVEQLVYNELLVGWPTKILCSEDCKGICNVCGQNLNKGTCNCEDTGLDPRMSVIRDVFKNFKEV